MTEIDLFLAVVAEEVSSHLDNLDPLATQTAQWLVISRAGGVELSTVEEGEPHKLRQAAIDQGADAVAYVAYVPGYKEQILAYVLVAEPTNSDIRRSHVIRREGVASLGPWEYTV
jgi:hypothetical protein